MRVVDGVDPPLGLDHPLVVLADEAQELVALDHRLGELALQRAEEPHLAGDVGGRIDEAVLAAEVGEPGAQVAQVVLGLGELLAGEAHRVLARLVGERGSPGRSLSARIALAIAVASSGVKALARTWMMPACDFEIDLHHPVPVGDQRLDRGVVAEGEDEVARCRAVVDARAGRAGRRPPRRSPGCG